MIVQPNDIQEMTCQTVEIVTETLNPWWVTIVATTITVIGAIITAMLRRKKK